MSRLIIVVGGQFGSEAKGHVAAQLAQRHSADLVIRTGGPNAGHTVYGPPTRVVETGPEVTHIVGTERQVHKLRQLPTAAVSEPRATLAIAAGGLIDSDLLWDEMRATGTHRVLVDRNATLLMPHHRHTEEADPAMQWGSTKEGIGAARADRIHRTATTAGEFWSGVARASDGFELIMTDVAELARNTLSWGGTVLIEAAQGYGLGLHTRFYPKTTSADCRAIDALADVGLSPWHADVADAVLDVWVCMRPYPIRVAGDSGPLLGETTWEALGLPEERTTVTNKIRRVGTWDHALAREAIEANGGGGGRPNQRVRVAFTMVDQVVPGLTGFETLENARMQDLAELAEWYNRVSACGADIGMLTTSPTTAVFGMDKNAVRSQLAQALTL